MSLREAQIAISAWVRAPEGVAVALAEEDSLAGVERPADAMRRLEDLIRSDPSPGAMKRLEIYANAYFNRIFGVLCSDYPALLGLIGRESFNDLVTSYLLVEPSRHASLRYAGSGLADFLSTHEAAAGFRERWPWAGDLADFEWARIDVFDAIDGPILSREAVASRSPLDFGGIFLCLGPWVRVCSFDSPVDRLWRDGVAGKTVPPEEGSGQTRVLVWRRDERVMHRSLEPREKAALARLVSGTHFDELCEWTALESGDEGAPAEAAAWLEKWLADRLLIVSDAGSAARRVRSKEAAQASGPDTGPAIGDR